VCSSFPLPSPAISPTQFPAVSSALLFDFLHFRAIPLPSPAVSSTFSCYFLCPLPAISSTFFVLFLLPSFVNLFPLSSRDTSIALSCLFLYPLLFFPLLSSTCFCFLRPQVMNFCSFSFIALNVFFHAYSFSLSYLLLTSFLDLSQPGASPPLSTSLFSVHPPRVPYP
jgi:hypothetical protein